jgi:hypothetical protein
MEEADLLTSQVVVEEEQVRPVRIRRSGGSLAGNGGSGSYIASFTAIGGSPAGWFAGGGGGIKDAPYQIQDSVELEEEVTLLDQAPQTPVAVVEVILPHLQLEEAQA